MTRSLSFKRNQTLLFLVLAIGLASSTTRATTFMESTTSTKLTTWWQDDDNMAPSYFDDEHEAVDETDEISDRRQLARNQVKIRGRSPKNKAVVKSATYTLKTKVSGTKGIKRVDIQVKAKGASKFESYPAKHIGNSVYSVELSGLKAGHYSWRVQGVNKRNLVRKTGWWSFQVKTGSTTSTSNKKMKYGLQNDCQNRDTSKYNICLDLKGSSSGHETWMEAFGPARDRWEKIIVDDDGEAINIKPYLDSGNIATSLPKLVDDVYIAGVSTPIDGRGRVLGMAGPTLLRKDGNGKYRALAGMMKFDSADIQHMISGGTWEGVILHEMGHVLGIGTLWWYNEVHSGSIQDDTYHGKFAKNEWAALGCSGSLPVETDGGQGTAGGHWDEKCLEGELMTGWVDDKMYLSRLTVASLKDMGYGVNLGAADPFDISRLHQCGNYCPEARRQLRRGLSPNAPTTRNPVSEVGHLEVLQAAAKELRQAREDAPQILPAGVEYVADTLVSVYIEDIDGIIKEETVTWEEIESL